MKNIKSLLSETAAVYNTTEQEITDGIRAYFDHLMEDSAFRDAWEQIPKADGISDEEYLLALMLADAAANR